MLGKDLRSLVLRVSDVCQTALYGGTYSLRKLHSVARITLSIKRTTDRARPNGKGLC